jgi:hypothetical protein
MGELLVCLVEGCEKPKRTKGMCNACYEYMRIHGTVDRPRTRQGVKPEVRIWKFVNKDGPVSRARPDLGPCWLWTGSAGGVGGKGYGLFHWSPVKSTVAHRAVWLLTVGEIPTGMQLDHLCRVLRCVNPAHLEVVTNLENMARMAAAREKCRNGHEWTPDSFDYVGGNRLCRECKTARFERFYARHGGKAAYRAAGPGEQT